MHHAFPSSVQRSVLKVPVYTDLERDSRGNTRYTTQYSTHHRLQMSYASEEGMLSFRDFIRNACLSRPFPVHSIMHAENTAPRDTYNTLERSLDASCEPVTNHESARRVVNFSSQISLLLPMSLENLFYCKSD